MARSVICRINLRRDGVMISRRSAGSSKDSVTLGRMTSPRSSFRALSRMRAKKRSVDSTPIRILPTRRILFFVDVLAYFNLEALLDLLIRFKLHGFHYSLVVPMMTPMRIVVA